MQKKLVPYLIRRYLRFDKSQPFITISAGLAFIGVMIGVAVLMVAMAIMSGMIKDFEEKISTMNYPMTIVPFAQQGISSSDLVSFDKQFPDMIFSPYIYSQAMAKQNGQLAGGVIYGVDFSREIKANRFISDAIGGDSQNISKFNLVMGKGMQEELFLVGMDEKVTLLFTDIDPAGLGVMPRMKRFEIAGIFDSGLRDYDTSYMFTSLESLRIILGYPKGVYDGIHIFSENPMEDIKKIKQALPPYAKVVGWWELNGTFFAALALEKKALFIILTLIVVVASLNIISSLLMTVMSRRREIALLLSLGAYKSEIRKTFFYLGITIGGTGIIVGVMLGFFSMYILDTFNIITLPKEVYGTSKLPIVLSTIDFFSILIGSILIVFLSSYYPAKRATNIDVLSTLRNE